MPAVLLLGPSRWLGPEAHPQGWPDPLTLRREVAALMRKAGADVVVMEDEPDLPEEGAFPKLARLGATRDVDLYVLLWPFGARLHGLEVEVGHLLGALLRGDLSSDQVVLLAESRSVGVLPDGTLSLDEPGNRTRYHLDLLRLGCPLRRWRHADALHLHALGLAQEHRLARRAPAA